MVSKRVRRRGLAKFVKKVALSNTETKHVTSITNIGTFFNRMSCLNLVGASQGSGQNNVLGEEIFIKGFRIRLHFSNFNTTPLTAASTQILVALIWDDRQATPTTIANEDPANWQTVLSGNVMIDRWNTDTLKVLKTWRLRMTPQFSGQNIDKQISAYVPINRKFRWNSNGLQYGRFGTYYLVTTMWAPGSNSGTPTPGDRTFIQTTWNTTMYWKDP